MSKTYRAVRDSYGFRSKHWAKGDIAEEVQDSEGINEHFEPVAEGEEAEAPKHPSFTPPEPTTLSEMQGLDRRPEPKPKPEPTHVPKAHPREPVPAPKPAPKHSRK